MLNNKQIFAGTKKLKKNGHSYYVRIPATLIFDLKTVDKNKSYKVYLEEDGETTYRSRDQIINHRLSLASI